MNCMSSRLAFHIKNASVSFLDSCLLFLLNVLLMSLKELLSSLRVVLLQPDLLKLLDFRLRLDLLFDCQAPSFVHLKDFRPHHGFQLVVGHVFHVIPSSMPMNCVGRIF